VRIMSTAWTSHREVQRKAKGGLSAVNNLRGGSGQRLVYVLVRVILPKEKRTRKNGGFSAKKGEKFGKRASVTNRFDGPTRTTKKGTNPMAFGVKLL